MPKPAVKVLYVGPFVLEATVQRKANEWRQRLQQHYPMEVALQVAAPPYEVDDLECKGYWLKPEGRTYEA